VNYEKIPWVVSTVDSRRVKASYNGGLTIVHSKEGLFGMTAEFFVKSMKSGLFPRTDEGFSFPAGHGDVSPAVSRLWGSSQACLSLAVTALGLDMRILPPSQNFPLHSYPSLSQRFSEDPALVVAHAHYHHLLRDPSVTNPILEGSPGFPEESRRWLKERLSSV
jgi:hypothetical protein